MYDFKCITEDISTIKECMDQIQESLDNTLNRGRILLTEIESGSSWAGEAQLVGTAFMKLVVQYHQKLAGNEGGPVCQASEAFQKYLDNDEIFYDEWKEYTDVSTM